MFTPRRFANTAWLGLCLTISLLLSRSLAAQGLDAFGGLDDPFGIGGGELGKVMQDMFAPEDDLDLLKYSHYSELYRWAGVEPHRTPKDADFAAYGWKAGAAQSTPPRTLVSSRPGTEAWTMINIPESRDYRLWLGYLANPGRTTAVTLSLSGSNTFKHNFASRALPPGKRGTEIEKELPIRFEDELSRISQPTKPLVVWEFVDLKLNAGNTRFALSAVAPQAQVDGMVITCSRTAFSPAKSMVEGEGNLYQVWCRARVTKASGGAATYKITSARLGYHWRRIPRGWSEPMWYGGLGSADKKGFVSEKGSPDINVGSWTRWVNITQDVSDGRWASGGGPWATATIGFGGVSKGNSEIQLSWYPHEGGVVKTITPGIDRSQAVFMMPLEALSHPPATTNTPGAWGMRHTNVTARLESAETVHQRHFEWGRAAVSALGAAAANPKPHKIHLTTSFGVAPAAIPTAARMLASIGINDVGDLAPELLQELNLPQPLKMINAIDSEYLCLTHDPLDPVAEKNFEAALRVHAEKFAIADDSNPPLVRILMGDEISNKGGAATVNGLESCRNAFYDYLRETLTALNTNATYYGVERLEDIPFLDAPPEYAGTHANRIYYASSRFKFIMTALYYAQCTRAAERLFPKVQTYCNFSPHPPMFGQHMNGNDWFELTRHRGSNLAWGEDWAGSGGSWGFSGIDVVSYYGAWVECAARLNPKLPAGFYAVSSMGAIDRKIFSLLARGIHWINVYSWGPMYAGAEGSNFWSESPHAYHLTARAAYALGPADTIITKGTMEPRRVGLLYNRTHEIWQGSTGGFQSDRLLLFSALAHHHIPAEIFLMDDCTDEKLAPYKVLYIQGYNFEQRAIQALRRWVEAGGTLIGIAGTAIYDEGNTATGDDERLFGTRQTYVTTSSGGWHPQALPGHKPIDTITLLETPLTPPMEVDLIGVKFVLTPTSGTIAGTYRDGTCAAVINKLGKGQTLLYGFQPGHIYKGPAPGPGNYTLSRLPMITKATISVLGRQRLEYSEPQTEVWLYQYQNEMAVTLNKLGSLLAPDTTTTLLTLQTDLKPAEIFSTLHGPLQWQRKGDRLHIDVPVFETVDVVIIR